METVADFIFGGSKITEDGDCSHETERRLLLGKKVMTNLHNILKSRDITLPTITLSSQGYGFSSSPVWMWELDCEEGWAPKNWCIWTVVLEKTLESPLDCRVSSVQLFSCVRLFATPWIAAYQASLSITNSRSSLRLKSIESVMPSNISSSVVPFSSCPQSLPASGSFLVSQLFSPGGQSIGVSASASVLPMNTQDWSPLGWTGWISLQSKGLSRVFCNTTVQKHQFCKNPTWFFFCLEIHFPPLCLFNQLFTPQLNCSGTLTFFRTTL